MTAPAPLQQLPPPPRRTYTGPVLVDPGNDRPGLHPDYNALAKARTEYRPWGNPGFHRRPAVDLSRIVWLSTALAVAAAPLFWLLRP